MVEEKKLICGVSGKRKRKRKKKHNSPAGNRTRVFRVTGGDTYHYTTEDICTVALKINILKGIPGIGRVFQHHQPRKAVQSVQA